MIPQAIGFFGWKRPQIAAKTLEEQMQVLEQNWSKYDFFFIHFKYTDSTGDDAYNQALSERRAESVRAALQAKLPGTITLTAEGKGEADPIADNGTDDGRALNRRVTITLPK